MLARTPIKSRLSVQNDRRLSVAYVVATLVMLSVVVGLEVSAAAPRTIEPSGHSSAASVDRTRKGDRLISAPAVRPSREMQGPVLRPPAANSKLAAGCEPSVSSLARTEWSTVAARCVS
jgi:hypothetical protein